VAAAVAVADGLRRAFDLSAGHIAAGVLAVLVVGLAVALVIRAARRPAPALAIAAAGAILLAIVGGYALQRRYADHRLRGQDAAVDYYLDHAHDGDRAALAEQWSVAPPGPVYALFGDRLRNDVRYAGLHEDGVNKPYRDARTFADVLRRGNYGWLMVGRGLRPNGTTPAMRWAPAAGFVPVATTPRLALYRRAAGP
jgi:ABC-type nickel/cobalt efflux system permease component RcnA